MKKILFFIAFFVSFSAFSQDFSSATIKNILTNGSTKSWKATKIINNRQDITAITAACELDNIFTLNANGTFEFSEGAAKCNSSSPDVIWSGTWTYDESLHYVNFVSGSQKFIWGINATAEGKILIHSSFANMPEKNRNYEMSGL